MTGSLWLPKNGALHGAALDHLLAWNLGILTVMLLLAHVVLGYALLQPRRRARQSVRAQDLQALPSLWRAETLPVLACCLLFAMMAITSGSLWAKLRYDGPAPAAMQVEVVGVQFQWYFRYPGPDATFGGTRPALVNAAAGNPLGLDPADEHSADDVVASVLMLPVGREVDVRLRAHDVIHGLFIPGMRLKENAVPGLELHVHFTPDALGDYPILCTQVCGSGHARMQAVLRVVSDEQFAEWLTARERQTRAHAPPLGAQ